MFNKILIFSYIILSIGILIVTLGESVGFTGNIIKFNSHPNIGSIAGGVDMQWSPSRLLLSRINPYQYYLEGNPGKKIIECCQTPNYLHLLYILMLPIGALTWKMAKIMMWIINAFLGISTVLFLGKKENIPLQNLVFILMCFLSSLAFRVCVANGQTPILILFFSMISFYCRSNITYFISTSIAIVKYSFAPPLLMREYYKNGIKRVGIVAILSIVIILIFSFIVRGNPALIAFQPFIVSYSAIGLGVGDIMSIVKFFSPAGWNFGLGYILSISFSLYLMRFYFSNKKNDSIINDFAYSSLVSLICFVHGVYDYVFLVPLIFAAYKFQKRNKIIIFCIIGWFWFGTRVLELFSPDGGEMILHDTMLLHFILLLIAIRIFCIECCITSKNKMIFFLNKA